MDLSNNYLGFNRLVLKQRIGQTLMQAGTRVRGLTYLRRDACHVAII